MIPPEGYNELFVFFGAQQESASTMMRTAMRGIPVMIANARLSPRYPSSSSDQAARRQVSVSSSG